MARIVKYFEEINYDKQVEWCGSYSGQKTPEEVLLEKESAELQEKIDELKERLQRRMREIVIEKFEKVLSKSERDFLRKLLLDIDSDYLPEEETQHTAAERVGVTREYFGLLIHRVYKKIQAHKEIKRKCLRAYKRELQKVRDEYFGE